MWWIIGAIIVILAVWGKINVDNGAREKFRRKHQSELDDFERSRQGDNQ
jgi:hypothetical protein